jgi:AcrR family transcriptional regulator
MVKKKSVTLEPRKRGRPLKTAVDASVDIRKAALQAFARAGFNGASILEIAREAGVAKPLVYYHYASKDALWEAAVTHAVNDLRAEMLLIQQAMVVPASAESLVRELSRQLVVFASRHPELVHIVVDETGKGGQRAEWLKTNFLLPGYAMAKVLLEGFTRKYQPANSNVAVEHLVPMVLGIMNFPFMDAAVIRGAFGVDVYSGPYIDQHCELLFKIIWALLYEI